MRRTDYAVVVLATALLVGSAAGIVAYSPIRPNPDPSPPPVPTPPPPMVIREGMLGTIATLDPLFARSQPERDVAGILFRGLTRVGERAAIEPDLARTWRVEEEGAAYVFEMRWAERWHDGLPVTADDVVFTVATLQDPAYTGPYADDWRDIEVERVDRFTVRFRLPEPLAAFITQTTLPIVPRHLLEDVPVAERPGSAFASAPIGSGPLRFRSASEDTIVLERFGPPPGGGPSEHVTDELAALPEPTPHTAPDPRTVADGYEIQLYGDDRRALEAAFRAGELHAVSDPTASLTALDATPGTRVVRYPRGRLTAILPNVRFEGSVMRDPLVRRALSAAIDRDEVVNEALGGAGLGVQSPIRPTSFAHDPAISTPPVHDPATARTLLGSAGWQQTGVGWLRPDDAGEARIELLTVEEEAAGPIPARTADLVAAGWLELGIPVSVVRLDPISLAERLEAGDFDAVVVDVELGLDPDLYPLLLSRQARPGGTNIGGYQSSVLDDLLESARLFADASVRRERFSLLQALLVRELPFIPVAFQDSRFIVRDELEGPDPTEVAGPEGRYHDVLDWSLASDPG